MLDLSSLTKGIHSLERALAVAERKELMPIEEDERELIQAGVIKNFEFSYELCWKFMKRWIEEQVGPNTVEGVPRIELFRVSAQNLLIDDVDLWMKFHRARNQSSHIYDEIISNDIYKVVKLFLPKALAFLENLVEKNV